MIIVAGTVKVRSETRAEAQRAAAKMVAATRQEAGCRSYGFYPHLDDPDTLLVFEVWDDEAALARHFQTPHMAEFNAAVPRFLAAPPSIDRYEVSGVTKMM